MDSPTGARNTLMGWGSRRTREFMAGFCVYIHFWARAYARGAGGENHLAVSRWNSVVNLAIKYLS